MNLRCIAAALLPVVAFSFADANAQPAPPPNATTWTSIGPLRTTYPNGSGGFFEIETSGRIETVAVDPSGTVYVGAPGGGVWKRVGSTWVALTDDQPSLVIGSLAIDPSDPATIYAGTGMRGSMPGYYGAGILKST